MTFEEFFEEWQNNNDFIEVKTSGSTGVPKEIKLKKEFVKESALRTIQYFHITKNQRLHSCVAADFIGGKMMAVRSKLAGAQFSWEEPSNQPLKGISKKESIDLLSVVPSQMLSILDNLSSLPEIKNFLIGGSPIHSSLRKKIAASGLSAYESYGMTETASHIALRKIEEKETPFKILSGIRISLDSEGALKIGFKDGIEIQTNDLAEIVSENEFFIRGRRDDIINSGGRKINPVLIEDKISSYINLPLFISSIKDEKWGEKVVLILEKTKVPENSEQDEFNIQKVKELLKEVLTSWEMPKEVYYVEKIPRTQNGKVLRNKSKLRILLSQMGLESNG